LSDQPKLRGKAKSRDSLYPLGEFPDDVIVRIGRQIVHLLAVGNADISGDNFASIFATAISGEHRAKPLGITDVTWCGCSWSAKTVSLKRPFTEKSVRLISGRNSITYSYGNHDPFQDLPHTGECILKIWNGRVDQSLNEFQDLRIVTLIRDMSKLEFTLFEYEATRYSPGDYEWKLNKEDNFEGFDKATGKHCFTWQSHGSQFTVIKTVPGSAHRFRIKRRPGTLDPEHVLSLVGFNEDWIEKVENLDE